MRRASKHSIAASRLLESHNCDHHEIDRVWCCSYPRHTAAPWTLSLFHVDRTLNREGKSASSKTFHSTQAGMVMHDHACLVHTHMCVCGLGIVVRSATAACLKTEPLQAHSTALAAQSLKEKVAISGRCSFGSDTVGHA
jgi:hypothetical protein